MILDCLALSKETVLVISGMITGVHMTIALQGARTAIELIRRRRKSKSVRLAGTIPINNEGEEAKPVCQAEIPLPQSWR